jgi:hypothetical protein
MRLLTALFLCALTLFQAACVFYQRYPMAKSRLAKVSTDNLTFYLLDPSRPLSGVWYVDSYRFGETSMQAYLSRLSEREALEVVTVRNSRDARESRNEVLIYVKPQAARAFPDTLTATLAYDQLEKVEVYEVNYGKTMAVNFLGYVAAGFVLALALVGDKDGCPFVYALNPDGTVFEGELYSGATHPQLERHDWLPMPHLRPNGSEYHIRLANKAKEIQHTNLLELVAVDCPLGTEALYDKYGQLHTLSDPRPPLQALDFEGNDALAQVRQPDSLIWCGSPQSRSPRAEQGLTLTFERPAGATRARLAVRAKNTCWLDQLYGHYLDEFGQYAPQIRQQGLKKSGAELSRWAEEQNLPLSVSVETAPGHWQRADCFHLAGPMALKKDVLELDLSQVVDNQVRVRLESGFQFWEVDWAALDFSEKKPVAVHALPPLAALDQNGHDVAASLAADDAAYCTQPSIGDEAIVHYPAPPQAAGTARSLLLHAKGHYEILRPAAPGKPSLRHLRSFEQPDALARYSRERWEAVMRAKM